MTADLSSAHAAMDAVRRAEAETKAMKVISRELGKLDHAAQRRVLNAFLAATRRPKARRPNGGD